MSPGNYRLRMFADSTLRHLTYYDGFQSTTGEIHMWMTYTILPSFGIALRCRCFGCVLQFSNQRGIVDEGQWVWRLPQLTQVRHIYWTAHTESVCIHVQRYDYRIPS